MWCVIFFYVASTCCWLLPRGRPLELSHSFRASSSQCGASQTNEIVTSLSNVNNNSCVLMTTMNILSPCMWHSFVIGRFHARMYVHTLTYLLTCLLACVQKHTTYKTKTIHISRTRRQTACTCVLKTWRIKERRPGVTVLRATK